MDKTDFIESSVRLQLGGVAGRKLVLGSVSRKQALAGSSGSALAWNTANAKPYAENGWVLHPAGETGPDALNNTRKYISRDKSLGALLTLLEAGAMSDLVIDMQDRRLRNITLPDGSLHPVFSFNRRIGDTSRILWPLSIYHDIGAPGFLGPSDWIPVPWADKRDIVGWRGNLNGRADWRGDVRREGLRLKPLYKQFSQGKITEQQTQKTLAQFPRHRLMRRYIDDPRFDIGFTGADGMKLENFPFMRPYMRAQVTQQAFRGYKYLLVLRGMDVGSSFYWSMNSGSVALVMEGPFETFASGHFQPWEHYVPFKADLSDLEDRVAWCRANDEACRAMAEKAQKLCQMFAQEDLRKRIGARLIETLEAQITADHRV